MSEKVKFCKQCSITGKDVDKITPDKNTKFRSGYSTWLSDDETKCPYCGSPLEDINISSDDYFTIRDASNYNRQLLEAMIELNKKDIIEYELKMSQFRNQAQQQNQTKIEEDNKVKCPKCGSTEITAGQKGYTLLTGFLGSNKTVNRCANCGHSWKPGK